VLTPFYTVDRGSFLRGQAIDVSVSVLGTGMAETRGSSTAWWVEYSSGTGQSGLVI